jgi:hypothetical protein
MLPRQKSREARLPSVCRIIVGRVNVRRDRFRRTQLKAFNRLGIRAAPRDAQPDAPLYKRHKCFNA